MNRIREVECPQCRQPFELCWVDDGRPLTLIVRSWSSGVVWDVVISCPHCNYIEDL